MEHDVSLISTVAAAFGVAMVLGFLAERVKIPALVGYLLAGILIGPATPGFVADAQIAAQLSEIGIMLLMFGVGLHFSPQDLWSVKKIAIPGALILGLSLACASTVVLLKALETRGQLDTMNGRIAVGWLVVQDLVTVLALVLLPPLAGVLGDAAVAPLTDKPLWMTVGKTLLEVGAFIALMFIVGKRVLPWFLWQVAKTGSRELFTLAVIATAIGIAFGASQFFGVSFALGAFVAGVVMRESEYSHRAAEETLPLRDAFSVLFFVSIGMVVDPNVLVDHPLKVMLVVLIAIFGNLIAALVVVLVLKYPLNTALSIAVSLGQIGEFSIILAGLGLSLGLLSSDGVSLILAAVLISISTNSFLFAAIEPVRRWVLRKSAVAPGASPRPVRRAAHVHRPQVFGRPGGAGGLWPGGPTHCRLYGRAQHSLCSGGAKPRGGGGPAQGRARSGLGQWRRARGADSGPHCQGRHAGGGHARHPAFPAHGRHGAHAQPRH